MAATALLMTFGRVRTWSRVVAILAAGNAIGMGVVAGFAGSMSTLLSLYGRGLGSMTFPAR